MAAVKWIVHHHTHAGPGRPTVDDIADYQTGPDSHLPFPAIAYHLYIEADGTIIQCHDIEAVTWAQGTGSPGNLLGVGLNNWWAIAVCLSGEHPAAEQVAAIVRVDSWIDGALARHLPRVGHRDVSRSQAGLPLTECPGASWPEWADQLR